MFVEMLGQTWPDDYAAARKACLEALARGEVTTALKALKLWLYFPARPRDVKMWADVAKLLAQIAAKVGDAHMKEAALEAASHPQNGQAWYELAYLAHERKLYAIAATLLVRADEIEPDNPQTLAELSANLDSLMLHAEAAARLKTYSGEEPLLKYLLAYHLTMSGQPAQAVPVLERARDPQDPKLSFMIERLNRVLTRVSALEKDIGSNWLERDPLRAWHAALHGALLLHLSPYGFETPMNGRYAFLQDSYESCREALSLLQLAIEGLALRPECVLLLNDRSSRILGLAAARHLGLPARAWTRQEPGLIVAYDLADAEDEARANLWEHFPGQILWAHTSCWTDPDAYPADITTLLYQTKSAPWSPHLVNNPETNQLHMSVEDNSPEEELAERILKADSKVTSHHGAESLASFLQAARVLPWAAWNAEIGPRDRQRVGSPVGSAMFA